METDRYVDIPECLIEQVKQIAAGQGVDLETDEQIAQYLIDDEEALEVVLPYLENPGL